jgi:hypothetical protein
MNKFEIVAGIAVVAILSIVTFTALDTAREKGKEVQEPQKVEESSNKETMREDFLGGCISEDSTYAYCNCAFEAIYKDLGEEKFMKESVEFVLTDELPEELKESLIDATLSCAQ